MVSNHSCTVYKTEEMKADWIACKTTSSVVFHFRLHWWIWFFPKLLLHYYLHHTLYFHHLGSSLLQWITKYEGEVRITVFFFPRVFQQFFYIKHVLVAVILKKLVLPKKVLWSIVDLLTSFIILEYILVLIMLLLGIRDRGPPVHQFPLITIKCYPSQRKLLLLYY